MPDYCNMSPSEIAIGEELYRHLCGWCWNDKREPEHNQAKCDREVAEEAKKPPQAF